ncbi:MAG: Modification methylase PaeR7I [Pseudomonadota bacterium]|jgi:methylase of polypeptide subunit release factors
MAIDIKPLFPRHVVTAAMGGFSIADADIAAAQAVFAKWADLTQPGMSELKESQHLPTFLNEVFKEVLGYREVQPGKVAYSMLHQPKVIAPVDSEFADAALGRFLEGDINRIQAVVEGKGSRDPLDRRFRNRNMSAVQQAYQYAINAPCAWIIVTNMTEIRLYHKGDDQRTYERFTTEQLAVNVRELRRFLFLLGAQRLAPEHGECHLNTLRRAAVEAQQEVSREFYGQYRQVRETLLTAILPAANPNLTPLQLLPHVQKLLDRCLFIAFCEDRGLMKGETLKRAATFRDPYLPKTRWEIFKALFRAVDQGNAALEMPPYNGGLFAEDAALDALTVPDAAIDLLAGLGSFDFRRPDDILEDEAENKVPVDVDILGHIFEQSISDLERRRAELAGEEAGRNQKKPNRRQREGAFYTPDYITRYIVDATLGAVIRERFESLVAREKKDFAPRDYDRGTLKKTQRERLVAFWRAWLEDIRTIRVLDPACGSGAFLIGAFDRFLQEYTEIKDRLLDLGAADLFDAETRILEENIYGVDLNGEAVEIARLSIWIKTAKKGRKLSNLDATIVQGNSIVTDPTVDPRAMDWSRFQAVQAAGGFDVVLGNPPYIRHELFKEIKPHLEAEYAVWHGMADLYVYFFELGLRRLKPGGRIGYIVANKWLRAGYGEPLRRFLAEQAVVEEITDFGHAKQIFPDADTFPVIALVRRPVDGVAAPAVIRGCRIKREELRVADLPAQIAAEGFDYPADRLGGGAWDLEPPEVLALMDRIRRRGVPLAEYAGVKPLYGIKTGFNKAFVIDTATRNALVKTDPGCAEIIRPFLRGQDIKRWAPEWKGLYLIFTRRGIDIDRYPAVKAHLAQFRKYLEPRPDGVDGRDWPGRKPGSYKWYEIQDSVDYWEEYRKPKIFYQVIQFYSAYAFERNSMLGNDKTFFIPTDDSFLLATLNSPLMWWFTWRYLTHMKDEALTPIGDKMVDLPIALPDQATRAECADLVTRVTDLRHDLTGRGNILDDWLRTQMEVEKPTRVLQKPWLLDSDGFVAAVTAARKVKTPITSKGLKALRDEYRAAVEPMRALVTETEAIERRLSDLVNAAYGLTPEEVALMWRTAPPRMPLTPDDGDDTEAPEEIGETAEEEEA